MPDVNKDLTSVKKKMHFFYVLDTSGSMQGAPITALNDAMRSTFDTLRSVQNENMTVADFAISVLEFNNDARWTSPIPVNIDDFEWDDLTAGGGTELEVALDKLDGALTRNSGGRLDTKVGNKNPMIIFMSDGIPFDGWERGLERLNKNHWYTHAIKVAFALGEEADVDVLSKLVGTEGAVIKTDNLEIFKRMIRIVSATGSRAGTRSLLNKKDTESPDSGKNVAKEAAKLAAAETGGAQEVFIESTPEKADVISFG